MIDRKLLAPCGLYCGVCAVLIAHRENNAKFKERLTSVYGFTAEEIACDGCLSDRRFVFCKQCDVRSCVQEKGYEGCHQCDDFPCNSIDTFPMEVGKRIILRAVPQRRELGDAKWVQSEEQRYVCSHCGHELFRGSKRCRNCKESVDPD